MGPLIPGFEILSELGRGGMGIVYRARQISTDRIVALKVVRTDVLASLPLASRASTLERFRHEAQAAAKIEHDNLVTVYEVGEASGQYYYAMKCVQGRSLYEMVRNGPLESRRAAGYLAPIARALQLAHERGILHRDLKPHNILVEERTDRPLLADFGLAKFGERQQDLTIAGEVMGTPSYMSPEQACDAAKVTSAADVYSLGATLYHITTGRAPFLSASLPETIRQICEVEPVPPWVLNPDIDRDLETICLKCLQKEPERRYASSAALADDLERYLEGRPILARPAGPVERLARWCHRNPRMAGMVATSAAFAILAVAAIVVGYVQTKAALAKSELRLAQAMAVVNDLFTRFSEDELLDEPGLQPLRKDLLERALKHYNYFLAESGGDARVRDEVAAARFRVGRITALIGAPDAAMHHLSVARQMQEELLAKEPGDAARLKSLADTLNALGSLHMEMKSPDKALESYQRAATIRTRLAEAQPDDANLKRLLANTWMHLGMVEVARKDPAGARAEMLRAQDLRQQLLRQDESFAKARRDLAMGFYQLAKLELQGSERREEEAADYLKKAIDQFQALPREEQRSLRNRYYLAVCYRSLAAILESHEKYDEALTNYEKASDPMESLAIGNPDVLEYQHELVVLALKKAVLYEEQNDLDAARAAWTQMQTTARELVRRDAQNDEYRRDLATSLSGLGGAELLAGDPEQAARTLAAARDQLQQLLSRFPGEPILSQQLADTLANLAIATEAEKEE
jgi:tetratricopeptide (TPR) repeat protein